MSAAESSEKSSGNTLLVLGKISSILDAFSLSRPVLSLADIREATGMPTSTVQRLVANLMSQGFLDREEDAYRIGMRMAYWAAPATRGMEVIDVISPLLKTLRDTTGETACFFKTEQHYRVCVAMADTRHALRREMHLGKVLPLHAGSAGRVLLAWDPELLEAVLRDPLEPITESTITSTEDLATAVNLGPDRSEALRQASEAIANGEVWHPHPDLCLISKDGFRLRLEIGAIPGRDGGMSGKGGWRATWVEIAPVETVTCGLVEPKRMSLTRLVDERIQLG